MSRIPGWTNVSSLALRFVLFAGVAVCAQLAGRAWAAVIYVRGGATGTKNGHSWADAYTDLQAGLAAAGSGDEIWIAQGTYKPTSGTLRTVSFVLKEGSGLYGGFAGVEAERGQRDWKANATILGGDIGIAGDAADNTYHVVIGAHLAVLDGFTITGGNANGSGSFIQGGGMYNESCSPTVANCTFSSNTVMGSGLSSLGGGMYNSSSSPTVTNCTFSGNTAGGGWGSGGGMYNYDSSLTVTNCTFSGNTANDSGGGMSNYTGSPTVSNCIFWDNSAPLGAEIYKASGTPTFSHCDIRGSGGSGDSWNPALGADGGGNIGDGPRFVAPATPAGADGLWRTRDDGLRLQPDSPCIGAADPTVAPKTDTLGLRRKTAPDIGAYEFYWTRTRADRAWLLFK